MHIYFFFVIINVTISTIYSLFFDQIKIKMREKKTKTDFIPSICFKNLQIFLLM